MPRPRRQKRSEPDDYATMRKVTWERAQKASLESNSLYAVCNDEQREEFGFEKGHLVTYERKFIAQSERDA